MTDEEEYAEELRSRLSQVATPALDSIEESYRERRFGKRHDADETPIPNYAHTAVANYRQGFLDTWGLYPRMTDKEIWDLVGGNMRLEYCKTR